MGFSIPTNAVYWLWLQRRLGAGSHVILTVAETEGGARYVYESTPEQLWASGKFSVKTINALNERNLDAEKRILRRCEELGISVTTPDDACYPGRLLSIPDPPAVLFYKGRLAEMCARPCISIVGTRKATEYGLQATRELAQRLSRAGMTVVSGCARGIDTAAHNGALEAINGGTIAVLGCGINYRYNMANEELRRIISEKGALVSEYAPDIDSSPYHFPVRNRIISGLSLGTIVMEADSKSGSLITAERASEQGRQVFVVATGIGAPNSSGIIRLSREMETCEVRSPMDVLRHYVSMYPMHLSLDGAERELMFGNEPQPLPVRSKPDPMPFEHLDEQCMPPADNPTLSSVSEGAREIYSYLRTKPQLLDNLAEQAGIGTAEAMNVLTELELFGLVRAYPGSRYALI